MKEIPLTQGKVALIDDGDYELVSQYRWHARLDGSKWYAARAATPRGGAMYMHRFLLSLTDRRMQADHINGDGLDNRRSNLRTASRAENNRNRRMFSTNTSGYKGVSRCTDGSKWQSRITAHGMECYLGRFATPQEAALAYDAKARELHGEFARLNFPA